MNHRFKLIVATLALAMPLSACSGDSETSPYAMIDPPVGYSEIKGEGFTISAPDEFEQKRESNEGEPVLILEKPSGVETFPQRVAVVRDVDPVAPAAEQSLGLEMWIMAPGGDDADVERIELPAPRGESVFLVKWTENTPTGDGEIFLAAYWQLVHQVNDDLIFNVVATAPADEFDTAEVNKILRTFRPDDS